MQRTPLDIAFAIALLLLLGSCRAEVPVDGTAQMVARLDSIARQTDAFPRTNVHANKARVRSLRSVTPPADVRQWVQFQALLGQELLHAGDNLEAIDHFRALIDTLDAHPEHFPPGHRLAAMDLLAITYMRLGEADNCLTNPTIDRCLLPITEGGVHTNQRGSRQAIEQYLALLEADPGDLNAVWLLNVAYMTLGAYPADVPARWRIPPEALASEYDIGRFYDAAPALGLDVLGLSGGAAVDDFSGDGLLDVVASSWGLRDPLRYFENQGDGTFADRTAAAGLSGLVGGLNLVQADYDNDGHLDLFILRGAWLAEGHPNSLLRNNGDGTFADVTQAAGLLSFHPTQTAAWGDYDGDGHLDLFVGNESKPEAGPHPCQLYHNNGDGTFTDVAQALGLDATTYAKAVLWGDVNDDGRPDLFISNWSEPNLLFRNDGPGPDGRWRFTEIAAEAGVQEPVESFPAWFWDYDNDGRLDLFVSGWRATAGDMAAELMSRPRRDEPPRLYHNNGDGTFTDAANAVGINKVMYTMGSNYGDLDNDGWLDFYAGTGDPDFRSLMPNRMFRNAGGRVFQEVTASGGFGHLQKGHGVAFADLDNDGDQDVYAVIGGAYEGDIFHNILFENPGHGNHWITLRLEGTASNRSAIGARLRLDVGTGPAARSIYRTVSSGGSFGASSLQQEIGLGPAAAIEALQVAWPSGLVQRFEGIATDQVLHLREGADRLTPVALPVHRWGRPAGDPPAHRHPEE